MKSHESAEKGAAAVCLPLPGCVAGVARPGAWLAARGSACTKAESDGRGCEDVGLLGAVDQLGLVDASCPPCLSPEGFEILCKH